jgi:hypothetical protein
MKPSLGALLAVLLFCFSCASLARPGGGDAFDGDRGWSAPAAPRDDDDHQPSTPTSREPATRRRHTGSQEDGGSGGGGGGDVDIGFVIELVLLCVRYPALGAVVVTGIGGYWILSRRFKGLQKDWSVGAPPTRVHTHHRANVSRTALDRLRADDPHFSAVLLEDFVYSLYAELQARRPRGGLQSIAAFVAPAVATRLADPSLEGVFGVVIGALRFTNFGSDSEWNRLTVEVEVNLSEVRAGQTARYYAVDRLQLVRAVGARSRPPARARKLDCSNCGAPLEGMRGTSCGYCQQEVGGGRLDWLVTSVERLKTEERPPLVTHTAVERGNELPTLVAQGANARLAELVKRDPQSTEQALRARIELVFTALQRGWSTRDLTVIRPFVTDNLFQYFGYWIDLYQQQRARNVTENARILNVVVANVLSDAVYDSVTVRLFATSLDYTLSDDGQLLSGSRTEERAYTEYWTLIRGRSAQGRPRAEPVCPSCGAPLQIGMAGNCAYCHARIVSGDFDWVLSRIEQDEAYGG